MHLRSIEHAVAPAGGGVDSVVFGCGVRVDCNRGKQLLPFCIHHHHHQHPTPHAHLRPRVRSNLADFFVVQLSIDLNVSIQTLSLDL